MNARRPLACVAAVGALLSLSACEKPAPIVTVVNEGRSVHAEANTWCFAGQTGEECAERTNGSTALRWSGGTLGIDVDKELADGGWQFTIVDESQPEQPLFASGVQEEDHYYALRDLPPLRQGSTWRLLVEAVDEQGEPGRGSWEFVLRPRSA
jgi:hypothetical protein